MSDTSADSPTKKSSLYQDFLAERAEIMRHKWVMSEKANGDVGFEAALVDWTIHHREEWKKKFKKEQKKAAEK